MSSIAAVLCLPIFVVSALEDHTMVKVRTGQNATLPCVGLRDEAITLLEWRRPEHEADTYVFFYRNRRPYENYQHESYKGRVELREPSLKDGDVSVILENVSIGDTGTYECLITTRNPRSGAKNETRCSISLTVTGLAEEDTKDVGDKDGRDKNGREEDGRDKDGIEEDKMLSVIVGVSIFAGVLFIIFAVFMYKIYKKCTKSEVLPTPSGKRLLNS